MGDPSFAYWYSQQALKILLSWQQLPEASQRMI
jgi:hypothetical protein